jgi:hypothetical protein
MMVLECLVALAVFPGTAEATHEIKMVQFHIGSCPGKDSQIDDTSMIAINVCQNCQEIGLSPL